MSGVPMSEKKYDKRYGDRKDYQEWKKVCIVFCAMWMELANFEQNTPMFIPKL